jgi:DNA ligase D-like protein (predicted ligase)
LPDFIEPMLARQGQPFDSDQYLFEVKWDGTRALAFIDNGAYRLMNRRRREITSRYPDLSFPRRLAPGQVLDGEIVVLRGGKPDFQLLQRREQARSARQIERLSKSLPATYVAFDQLYHNYVSLLNQTLLARRKVLKEIVDQCHDPRLVFSDAIVGKGIASFDAAVQQGLEGIVAKRLRSQYLPGKRTDAWIKIKRAQTIACVVLGFVPEGPDDFGSLILGIETDGKLAYAGKVGSGLDADQRKRIHAELRSRIRRRPVVPCPAKGVWVEPALYCVVRCMERTPQGHLRAPVFVAFGVLNGQAS